jgi:hypothetical protein
MDEELACAELVCKQANLPLKVLQIKYPIDMDAEEVENTFFRGMHFYDGHVRMFCYFYESYNTPEYRMRVLGDARMGLNGIGGEQYRNDEHMCLPSWNIDRWVKYRVIGYEAGDCFKSDSFHTELSQYVGAKIRSKLLLQNRSTFGKLDLKRYQNEVFVPGRMGARNNAENQISFFFSPFTEHSVSTVAYKAVPHLGVSMSFEQAMIRMVNTKLAAVRSDYGYDFLSGEPMKRTLVHFLKELLPFSFKQQHLAKTALAKGSKQPDALRDKFPVFAKAFETVESLGLPIDLKILSCQQDLYGVIFSLGYLIDHYRHKILFPDVK